MLEGHLNKAGRACHVEFFHNILPVNGNGLI
jgi:hypothetical protein